MNHQPTIFRSWSSLLYLTVSMSRLQIRAPKREYWLLSGCADTEESSGRQPPLCSLRSPAAGAFLLPPLLWAEGPPPTGTI